MIPPQPSTRPSVAKRLTTLGSLWLKASESQGFQPDISLSTREAALLAWVLDNPSQRRRRDDAAHFFWPRKDLARSRHSLSQLIYAINKKAGYAVVIAQDGIILSSNCAWDVSEIDRAFELGRMDTVLELYGGPFLVGDADLRGPAADWRDEVEARVAAMVSEAVHDLSCTAHQEAIDEILETAEGIALKHTTLRKARIAVVNCLLRVGASQRASSRHAQFSNSDPKFPPLAAFESAWKGTVPANRSLPFKGRDVELNKLLPMLDSTLHATGVVAVITGEAGIGKTRLAEQVLKRAALRGFRVWSAGCCAATQRLPYSAAHELFRDNTISIDPDSLGEVESAFHALRGVGPSDPDELRHKLIDALTNAAMRSAARAPLIIFLDDAQWADQITALLFAYWAHRLREHRVMILLAVRTHDEENLPEWIATDLARASSLELKHLSIDSARDLVQAFEEIHGIAFDPSTRDAILWLSAGRPFLLMEALSGEVQENDDGSATRLTRNAESLLRRRFKGLGETAVAIYGFLAAWGKHATIDLLTRAVGTDQGELAVAIDSLLRRGILALNGTTLTFVHDLMRETAYRQLLPASKFYWHGRSADLAHASHEPDGFVAQQLAHAGRLREAATFAVKAAAESRTAHTHADQEFYLRLAIESGDQEHTPTAAAALAMLLIGCGRISEAPGLIPLMRADDRRIQYITLMAEMDSVLLDDSAAAKDIVSRAAELIKAPLEPEATGLIGRVLNIALDAGTPSFASNLFAALFKVVSSADAALQLSAYQTLWSASATGLECSLDEAEGLVRQLQPDYSPATKRVCHFALGTLQLLNGALNDAVDQLNAALREADLAGDMRSAYPVLMNRGVALMELGEYDRAAADFNKVLGSPTPNVRMRCYANMAILHFETGRDELAADAARALQSMNATYGSLELMGLPPAILGMIALRAGQKGASPPACQHSDAERNPSAFEDTSYQVSYQARVLKLEGRACDALKLLEAERERISRFNVVAGLRLACCSADIMAEINPDRAYRLASDTLAAAGEIGARTVRRGAEQLVQRLRTTRN